MTRTPPSGQLVPVCGGSHAWVQPDGGWGLSNAGLIVGDGESLLVDTLFDLAHTRAMMNGFASLTDPAPIRTVVNTHGNGDHWFGNGLVPDAEVVAAAGTLTDMRAVGPQQLHSLLSMSGPTGAYVRRIFGRYRFDDIEPVLPTRSYEHELELSVGGVDVLLIDVGPAHTLADTVVYCPRDGVVFTGDIVFAEGTPIVWAGPVGNWLAACRRIRELGARFVVPGHGPVSPVAVVTQMTDYLDHIYEQTALRHSLGMPPTHAALDIDLGRFATRPEAERLAVNVATIYRELDGDGGTPPDGAALFGCMAELAAVMEGAGTETAR